MPPLYLLDTNILVHLIRGDATGEIIRNRYALLMQQERPLLSIVTEAEIKSLALQWTWGEVSCEQMRFFISSFHVLPIQTTRQVEAFATLDAWSRAQGRKMGKNDLWIAATTFIEEAILLTTDSDFDHLNGTFFTVVRVPPVV
jgi:predicted nucleic acid-binding protein